MVQPTGCEKCCVWGSRYSCPSLHSQGCPADLKTRASAIVLAEGGCGPWSCAVFAAEICGTCRRSRWGLAGTRAGATHGPCSRLRLAPAVGRNCARIREIAPHKTGKSPPRAHSLLFPLQNARTSTSPSVSHDHIQTRPPAEPCSSHSFTVLPHTLLANAQPTIITFA
jgi:hypothetical protein